MSHLIIRPLFVFLTLVMLVLALFQVTGRLMFTVLDKLEVGVNQWLSSQHIVVSGLEGDWRRINPIVRIESVTLPAGQVSGLQVEIDWLESLLRNRLIARDLSLAAGRLLLTNAEGGWRLVGAAGGSGFDPFGLLYHSDNIDVSLAVGFVDGDGQAHPRDDVQFRYRATNRGGEHRHRLMMQNRDCTNPCRVSLALDDSEAIAFVRGRVMAASVEGAGLRLPRPLLAASDGHLGVVTGHWWRDGALSGGQGHLAIEDVGLNDDLLAGSLWVSVQGEGDEHHISLDEFEVRNQHRRWSLPRILLTFESGDTQSLLTGWTERIDTGTGFSFITALAPPETAAFRWLNALNAEASALNVHAFVRFPSLDVGYTATVQGVNLDGYNGSPWIRGAAGQLLGANQMLQLALNADDVGLQFPDMFHQRWHVDHLSGLLQAYVSRDYFALRGTHLKADLGGTHASARFSLSRPSGERYRERLSLLLNLDETTVERGKSYIPYKLPAGLPEWLEDGPRSGQLTDVSFAYLGQIHSRPFELARRVALSARIDAGHLQYHPDWPEVRGLEGFLSVSGRDVRIQVQEGSSLSGTDLAGSHIHLIDNASLADIDLRSTTTVEESLAFIRATPLRDWLAFITPDWAGRGPVRMAGRLRLPLKLTGDHIGEVNPANELEVDLDISLLGSDLDLPGFGVHLGDLSGDVHYTYPHHVSGTDVAGRIFNRPAKFSASSDEDTVIFHVDGQAPYEDVLALLGMRDPGGIHGGFDFITDLHIELGERASRLDMVSDLTGLELDLPGEFAKAADESVATELELRFLDDYQSARFRYGPVRGWLHVDEVPLRGAIGFSQPPPLLSVSGSGAQENVLVLGGRVRGFSISEVIPGAGSDAAVLALPVLLRNLTVGMIDVNGVPFSEVTLNGAIGAPDAGDLLLSMDSADLSGTLAVVADEPLALDLKLLKLPLAEPGAAEDPAVPGADPLSVDIIAQLVDADVHVDRFVVGELEYGSWTFGLRPENDGVALYDLDARLRDVHITSNKLFWDGSKNRTRFSGRLTAADLATVFPQWGYAASVSTERAAMDADLNWRGSPAAVDLSLLVGEASFEAENGRFLEVTQGTDAMKIFSLVNFSTIAKRLNFDFSDVLGEGVSFDKLTATTEFREGSLQFLEPMAVSGSGSNFRIGGTVDLVSGVLDNEMVVTLPVTKGLPWYAAYIALANPLAGLGVLVGERVLRKPLEQFSSAKYEISGTLDEPELKFIGVWDTTMDQPQVSLEQPEDERVDLEPADVAPEPATDPAAVAPEEKETTQNMGTTT